MDTFFLTVTACDRVFYKGRALQVVMPLEDGEKAIQAHHENMVFAVDIGEIRIQTQEGEWITGVVGRGFAQVINNRVSILVDTAEHPDEIDVRRARSERTGSGTASTKTKYSGILYVAGFPGTCHVPSSLQHERQHKYIILLFTLGYIIFYKPVFHIAVEFLYRRIVSSAL